jgi:ribosomal protein L3 glutamine methyltransferase
VHTIESAIDWTAKRFGGAGLVFGHGTDNASDEAAFLVLEALHMPFEELDSSANVELTATQWASIAKLVESRIVDRTPTAYLVGRAYIQGFAFRADERALIPRSFIGELLADAIGGGPFPLVDRTPQTILELGAGSASLAILAALAFPDSDIDAVDISEDALGLAAENVADYGLSARIHLVQGDLYRPVGGKRYDLIISNPPYVDANAMEALPKEYRHEPTLALAGGSDGLDLVRTIIAGAATHLTNNGGLICEVGAGQAQLVESFPDLDLIWLATESSEGEVFWLDAASAPGQNP